MVLAAGSARRFGADKRLQPFADSTVTQTTINTYSAVFDDVRVVVRDESCLLFTALASSENLSIVFSPEAHLGMGHSLAAGFKDLTWDYAFLALADMPLISIATTSSRDDPPPPAVIPFGDPGYPVGHQPNLFHRAEARKNRWQQQL